MFLGPRPVIRTPRVGSIRLLRAKLGGRGVRLLLKKFGVVVDRLVQFFVAVIKVRRLCGVEINPAPVLLESRDRDLQRWIVSVLDVHLQRLWPASAQLQRRLLKVDLL